MCRDDYYNCEYYHLENPDEHKCVKDSNVGYCTEKIEKNEELKNIGFNDDEIVFINQLCQIKNLTVFEYIRELVKEDLLDSGFLIINNIIENGGK